MPKKIFSINVILFFLLFLISTIIISKVYADQFDCNNYGTHQCINLRGSVKCVNGIPQITLTWDNPHNDSTFNIVYSHDGHWYMKPIWSKVSSTTIPAYGAWQDGGTANDKDSGFKATGGTFGAKITGGIPYSLGGSGITTGYSTPDWSTNMPNCTITPTPTITPTHAPTPSPSGKLTPTPTPPPPPTKGNLTVKLQGIGLEDNTSPLQPNRRIVLYFYPATDTSFATKPHVFLGTVNYNQTTGYFSNASFPLTGLVAGQYLVLARTPEGSLVSQIGTGDGTQPITIVTTGGANMLVDTQDSQDTNADTTVPTLLMGNTIQACDSGNCSFNNVDLLDYNALVDCFGDKSTTYDCRVHGILPQADTTITDFNNDGNVDGADFTTMMKNYGHFGIGQNAINRGGENIMPLTPTPPPPTPTPTHTPSQTPTPTPMHCGGFIENAPTCPTGFTCQLGTIPDMGGICVPVTITPSPSQ